MELLDSLFSADGEWRAVFVVNAIGPCGRARGFWQAEVVIASKRRRLVRRNFENEDYKED